MDRYTFLIDYKTDWNDINRDNKNVCLKNIIQSITLLNVWTKYDTDVRCHVYEEYQYRCKTKIY